MAASTRGAFIEFSHLFFQADDPDFLNRNRFQKRRGACDWGLGWGMDRFWVRGGCEQSWWRNFAISIKTLGLTFRISFL